MEWGWSVCFGGPRCDCWPRLAQLAIDRCPTPLPPPLLQEVTAAQLKAERAEKEVQRLQAALRALGSRDDA